MTDGFFSIAFTGSAGSGFGVVLLYDGLVAGADVAGASYDGEYRENPTNHTLDFRITMRAPAGLTPVQTGVPLLTPLDLPITASFPDDLGAGHPMLLETKLGPVNIVFRKIRDFPK